MCHTLHLFLLLTASLVSASIRDAKTSEELSNAVASIGRPFTADEAKALEARASLFSRLVFDRLFARRHAAKRLDGDNICPHMPGVFKRTLGMLISEMEKYGCTSVPHLFLPSKCLVSMWGDGQQFSILERNILVNGVWSFHENIGEISPGFSTLPGAPLCATEEITGADIQAMQDPALFQVIVPSSSQRLLFIDPSLVQHVRPYHTNRFSVVGGGKEAQFELDKQQYSWFITRYYKLALEICLTIPDTRQSLKPIDWDTFGEDVRNGPSLADGLDRDMPDTRKNIFETLDNWDEQVALSVRNVIKARGLAPLLTAAEMKSIEESGKWKDLFSEVTEWHRVPGLSQDEKVNRCRVLGLLSDLERFLKHFDNFLAIDRVYLTACATLRPVLRHYTNHVLEPLPVKLRQISIPNCHLDVLSGAVEDFGGLVYQLESTKLFLTDLVNVDAKRSKVTSLRYSQANVVRYYLEPIRRSLLSDATIDSSKFPWNQSPMRWSHFIPLGVIMASVLALAFLIIRGSMDDHGFDDAQLKLAQTTVHKQGSKKTIDGEEATESPVVTEKGEQHIDSDRSLE